MRVEDMPPDILCQDYLLMEKEWIKIIAKTEWEGGGWIRMDVGGKTGA